MCSRTKHTGIGLADTPPLMSLALFWPIPALRYCTLLQEWAKVGGAAAALVPWACPPAWQAGRSASI